MCIMVLYEVLKYLGVVVVVQWKSSDGYNYKISKQKHQYDSILSIQSFGLLFVGILEVDVQDFGLFFFVYSDVHFQQCSQKVESIDN